MRRFQIAIATFAFAAAVSFAATAFQPAFAAPGPKNCPSNTHLCYGCTGKPICVRLGVPCPECAPQ